VLLLLLGFLGLAIHTVLVTFIVDAEPTRAPIAPAAEAPSVKAPVTWPTPAATSSTAPTATTR
jgi:hypothetical protein